MTKIAKVTTELKPHQKRVVDRLMEQNGLVVAHGLGSGKTLSSIAAAEALGMPTAVLVPAALQENYKKEIEKHTDGKGNKAEVKSLQRAVLRNEKPDHGLVVIDEAHRLRDPGSKGHQRMRSGLGDKRMLLTATPVYNHPSDVAALMNLAAGEKIVPDNKSDFSKQYIKDKKVDPGFFARTFRGIKPGVTQELTNTKELGKHLKQWVDYHENEKGEDFPERKDTFVHVPMSKKQQEIYDGVLDQAPAWVKYKVQKGLPPSKAESKQLNAFLSAQRQVAGSPHKFVDGMSIEEAVPLAAKSNEAFKRMKTRLDSDEQHKALVYSNYLDSGLAPYEELLKKEKIPYGVFTGKVKKKDRDQMVKDYNEGKIKVLMVSSAGGEGLDLKGTRQIQVLDPHWNNEKIEQVIGRGIRYKSHADLPKSKRKVDVEHYLAQNRPGFLRGLLGMKSPDQTSDDYLRMLSNDKDKLNKQMTALMKKSTPTKVGQDLALARYGIKNAGWKSVAGRTLAGAAMGATVGAYGTLGGFMPEKMVPRNYADQSEKQKKWTHRGILGGALAGAALANSAKGRRLGQKAFDFVDDVWV